MFDTVHFSNYVALLMLLNDLPEYKLQDSNTQEKNHNIKTYDTQNSVWLHNFVSCDIFNWLLFQIFFVWAEVLWPVRACVRACARTHARLCVWGQWLSSIMTSDTSSYFSSLSLVTICVVSLCFTHMKDKTTFSYITKWNMFQKLLICCHSY